MERKRRLVLGDLQADGRTASMATSATQDTSATPTILAANTKRKRSASNGLSTAPDTSASLVTQKKWRREDLLPTSKPLHRSVSALEVLGSAPNRPSMERRQSAAAIDALTSRVHELALPTVPSRDHPDLNVISPETVRRALAGEFRDRLAAVELIDCRFPFEHEGGSLRGAWSLADPESVEAAFMARPAANSTRVALVFFCEFSASRAPKMARHVRNLDRWIHADRYPELFYPELYLINGGYKNCFETLKDQICHPPTYVRMNDESFAEACRLEFSAWRRRWKAHKAADCFKQFRRSTGTTITAPAPKVRFRRPVLSLADQL